MTRVEKIEAIAEIFGDVIDHGQWDREQAYLKAAERLLDILDPPKKQKVKTTGALIKVYCDLWKAKHGGKSPIIRPKDAGILSRIEREVGVAQGQRVLEAYFSMPDGFVIKARHPADMIDRKWNEILAFAESGRYVSQQEARGQESRASVQAQLARIEKGES